MRLEGFDGVGAAGGFEPAVRTEQRGDGETVEPEQENEDLLHEEASGAAVDSVIAPPGGVAGGCARRAASLPSRS